jgi:hypothetical protein
MLINRLSAQSANPLFLVCGERIRQSDCPGSVLSAPKRKAALEWVKFMRLCDVSLRKEYSTMGQAFLRTVVGWCLQSLKLDVKPQQLILLVR